MTRKLDKEHLEEIQSIREQFAQNANILGNIAIETHFLEPITYLKYIFHFFLR